LVSVKDRESRSSTGRPTPSLEISCVTARAAQLGRRSYSENFESDSAARTRCATGWSFLFHRSNFDRIGERCVVASGSLLEHGDKIDIEYVEKE